MTQSYQSRTNSPFDQFRDWLFEGVYAQQSQILNALEQLMITVTELAEVLNAIRATLEKARTEILNALANIPVTPETEEALARLRAVAQSLDDIVPDEPPAV